MINSFNVPYTKVPNALIEAVMEHNFNSTEHNIIWFIVRLTHGWNKEKAAISYGMLSQKLKVDIRYVKRLIKRLENNQVILVDRTGKTNSLGLNKEYKCWKLWKTKKSSGFSKHYSNGQISPLGEWPL